MMGSWTDCEILGSELFSFTTLKILTHSHLASRVVEKHASKVILGLCK